MLVLTELQVDMMGVLKGCGGCGIGGGDGSSWHGTVPGYTAGWCHGHHIT